MTVIGDIHDYIFHGEQKVREVFAKNDKDYIQAFDLAMRSNPDRILVPELTVGNANLILRAMSSGHKGFMLTLHAGDNYKGVAEAFAKNLKMSGAVADATEVQKDIDANVDFLIHLKKHKGKRVVEKVIINNIEVQKEAQELGIFGFKKEKKRIKNKKAVKTRSTIAISKLIEDLANGMSKTKISKKHGISRPTIISLSKKVKK